MRALFLEVERPISSKLLDPVQSKRIGDGALSRSASLFKPMREITIKSWDQLLRPQLEKIRNEIAAGRITGTFWLRIDSFGGDMHEPMFIAEGDGVNTQFPMPVNNVYPNSWVITVSGVTVTAWTMTADTITFTSAPTGRIEGYGKRKFKVMLQESESILEETEIYRNDTEAVGSVTPLVFIEVEGVNVF